MKKIALVVLLLAGSAFAIQQLDKSASPRLNAWINGILVTHKAGQATDALINANRITRALGATATIDFVSSISVCTDSAAITVLGARVGDPCFVGIPAVTANSTYSCYVSATDAAKVRHCANGATIDPASGSFQVRVLSSASN